MKRNIPKITLDDIVATLSSEFPTKIVVTSEHELIIHTGIKLDPDIGEDPKKLRKELDCYGFYYNEPAKEKQAPKNGSLNFPEDYSGLQVAYAMAKLLDEEHFKFENKQGTQTLNTKYAGYLLDYYKKNNGETPGQAE